jgi:hypothetical protein
VITRAVAGDEIGLRRRVVFGGAKWLCLKPELKKSTNRHHVLGYLLLPAIILYSFQGFSHLLASLEA